MMRKEENAVFGSSGRRGQRIKSQRDNIGILFSVVLVGFAVQAGAQPARAARRHL